MEQILIEKIREFEGYVDLIEKNLPQHFEEYLGDEIKKRALERLLEIAIQCMFDISDMLVKQFGLGATSDNKEKLDIIKRKGIIKKELAENLKKCHRVKEQLLYWYSLVDQRELFEFMQNTVGDFKKFGEQVKKKV
jgi:uncharacterized protein YutE (UPF0331/DUF86 family)